MDLTFVILSNHYVHGIRFESQHMIWLVQAELSHGKLTNHLLDYNITEQILEQDEDGDFDSDRTLFHWI